MSTGSSRISSTLSALTLKRVIIGTSMDKAATGMYISANEP